MRMLVVLGLEVFLGDPRWLRHPVEVMGALITAVERGLTRGTAWMPMKFKGFLLLVLVGGAGYLVPWWLMGLPGGHDLLWTYFVWTGLGIHSLYRHGGEILAALKKSDVEAREKLSFMVSRETGELDTTAVIRATVESLAENTSDGVIAPIFYLILGGVPLMMLYKAVNTLDAMVGYKNERYRDFGFASARMDDLMNLIPARITGLVLVLSAALLGHDGQGAFKVMIRDARKHESPNAGYPEAAMAGALGVALGGPGTYHGAVKVKAWLGEPWREMEAADISRAQRIMILASVFALIPLILLEVV